MANVRYDLLKELKDEFLFNFGDEGLEWFEDVFNQIWDTAGEENENQTWDSLDINDDWDVNEDEEELSTEDEENEDKEE